ncbi:MAG: IS66 family insertion sequence element accessory protein TnpB [Lachnospiraceae bacterium]|nr:IS66 family insertion sequence element accessory protein TnpB [Lachnospiraceae bacterium]
MTQSRALRRSQEEWLQLIMECRNSGMTDRTWCEQHGILVSLFYNAVKRLRKKACDIPYVSNKKPYALDLTAQKQEAVQIDLYPETVLNQTVPAPQATSVPHIDNSHTIELIMDDVSLKVSNSADPVLLQQIIRMLHPVLC